MNKKLLIASMAIPSIILGVESSEILNTEIVNASEVVDFEDKNLQAVLNIQVFGVTGSDAWKTPITKKQMETITVLHLPDFNIKSLSGLEYAVNLQQFGSGFNPISDISGLKNSKVNWMYLSAEALDLEKSETKEVFNSLTNLVDFGLFTIKDNSEVFDVSELNLPKTTRTFYIIFEDKESPINLVGLNYFPNVTYIHTNPNVTTDRTASMFIQSSTEKIDSETYKSKIRIATNGAFNTNYYSGALHRNLDQNYALGQHSQIVNLQSKSVAYGEYAEFTHTKSELFRENSTTQLTLSNGVISSSNNGLGQINIISEQTKPIIQFTKSEENSDEILVEVTDKYTYISKLYIEKGSKDLEYFKNHSNNLTEFTPYKDSFLLEDGLYTIYAEDSNGNFEMVEYTATGLNIEKPILDKTIKNNKAYISFINHKEDLDIYVLENGVYEKLNSTTFTATKNGDYTFKYGKEKTGKTIYSESEIINISEINESLREVIIPKFDIKLSINGSVLNKYNFEADLLEELSKLGVDLSTINIDMFKDSEISTNSVDAESIFNNWEMFPYNYTGNTLWKYNPTNKSITSPVDAQFETGFINKKDGVSSKFTLSSDITNVDGDYQPVGYVFNMNENDDGKHNLYYLWFSGDVSHGNATVAIFKVEGQNFNYLDRPVRSLPNGHVESYTALPLSSKGKSLLGWYRNSFSSNYGGFPDGTPQTIGTKVTNTVDPNMTTELLAIHHLGSSPMGTFNLKLDVDKNKFKVYHNENLVLDITDTENPYIEGYHGIFQLSNRNPVFKNLTIKNQVNNNFIDVINSNDWLEDSEKIIVHMDNSNAEYFSSEDNYNELLKVFKENDYHFLPLANDENKNIFDEYLNSGVDGDIFDVNDYDKSVYETALYIKGIVDIATDVIPPNAPVINLSTQDYTNQDVTTSVDYSEDSEIKLVKYNGLVDESKETYTDKSGQVWNIYEGDYTFTENGYIEAMSLDKSGNESVISKSIVNKIDKVTPENPIISSDNEEPTNQDVNINIKYDEDSFYKKYKIDNGEWLEYTGTFLMKTNGTIYAYGLDRAGNQSEIVEYIVNNIDKENTDNITITPNTTASTNKDVLVTLTSEQGEEIYYSLNDGEFIKYETPVGFEDNGVIKAYSLDKSGNVSELKEYIVSNIDKIAPETPIVEQEVTENTNKPYGLQLLNQEAGANTLYKFNNNDWVSLHDNVLNISQNGEYSFKYIDQAGNESEVTTLNIENFDYDAEDFYLTKEEFNTHGDIFVNLAEDFDANMYMLVNGEYIPVDKNKIQVYENGVYTFKCVDELGNEVVKDIEVNLVNIIPSIDKLDYPTVMSTPSVVTKLVENIENTKLDNPKDNEYYDYLLNHLAGLGQEELDKAKGSGTPNIDDVYKFATSGVLSTELGSYNGLGNIVIDNAGFNTLYGTLQELPTGSGTNTVIDLGTSYLQFLEDCGDGYIGGLTIDAINGGTSSPEYVKILNYIDCIPDEDTQNRLRDKLKGQVISLIEDCLDDIDGSGYSIIEIAEIGNSFGVLSGYGSGSGSSGIDIGGSGVGYISGLIGGLTSDNISVIGGQILDLIGCGCLNIPDEELTRLTAEFDNKVREIFDGLLKDKGKLNPLDEEGLEPIFDFIKCGCMPKETEDYLTGLLEEEVVKELKELITNTGSLQELDIIEKYTNDKGIDLTEEIEEQRAKIGLVESGGGTDTPEEPEITEDENIETDIIIPSDKGTNSNQVTESNNDLPQTGTEQGTNAGILLLITGLLGGLLIRRRKDKTE